MNPYTILGGVLLLIAVAFGGAHVGRKLERSAWQEKEIATAAETQKQLVDEHKKYVRLQDFNEMTARKATANHEKALSDLQSKYDAGIAAVRASGGLRVARTICLDQDATTAKSTGAGRPDEASAGTIQLPERVEGDLFALTKRADDLAEQLRALQLWVKENGHYGPAGEP